MYSKVCQFIKFNKLAIYLYSNSIDPFLSKKVKRCHCVWIVLYNGDYCAETKGLIPDRSHITLIHFQPKFKSKGFYASRYVVKKPRGHSWPHPPVNQVMTIFNITVHLVASMKWSEIQNFGPSPGWHLWKKTWYNSNPKVSKHHQIQYWYGLKWGKKLR